MNFKTAPIGRKTNIVVQELESELLIYDLITNKVYSLNETSAMVFQLCNGKRDISQIREKIEKQLNKSVPEELIWLALDQLKQEKLLEKDEQIPSPFAGLSRRQVIRKIGLSSAIALPIISSLIAPTPAMAALSNCGKPGCQPAGCPIGTPIFTPAASCSDVPDATKDLSCNTYFGSGGFLSPKCCGTAVYDVGTCSPIGPNVQFSCVCST